MDFSLKRIGYLTLLGAVLLINFSCKKNQEVIVSTIQTRGGLALTFDDYNVDNWHKYMYLLDSLKIKATFYVSNYNKLNAAQKNKLRELEQHGNEIAFHSTNHVNFLKYKENYKTFEKLMDEEVFKGLTLMNNDGFYPTTFAYPYGQHNEILDKHLLKYFKSVRALNGNGDINKSLASLDNNKIIYGYGLDDIRDRDISKIEGMLETAREKNSCAVLLVHNIEKPEIKLQLPLETLRRFLIKAKSLDLNFYTISEISTK